MSVTISDLEKAVTDLFPDAFAVLDEATRRACTNRQYYVTYHRLLQAIEQHFTQYDMSDEGTFGATGSHRRVFLVLDDIYRETKSKEAQKLSLKFDNFLSKRHKADYHLDKNFDKFDYKQILDFANDIPKLLVALVDSHDSNHLTKAAL